MRKFDQKMNARQNKIPIAEFREVKFVPTVLFLKTGLKPTIRQRGRPATSLGHLFPRSRFTQQ